MPNEEFAAEISRAACGGGPLCALLPGKAVPKSRLMLSKSFFSAAATINWGFWEIRRNQDEKEAILFIFVLVIRAVTAVTIIQKSLHAQ